MISPEQIIGRSILAFWEKDIPYLKHAMGSFEEKPILAPMESKALQIFPGKSTKFFLPDSLLSQEDIDKTSLKGKAIVSEWVKACGEYSWAAYASNSLEAVLPGLLAAEAISGALLKHNIERFCCVMPSKPSSQLQWYSPDIPKFAFQDTLFEKFRAIPVRECQKRILEPAAPVKHDSEWDKAVYDYEQISGATVFVIYAIDIYRFKKIIEGAKKEGKKVVILLYSVEPDAAKKAADFYNVPVLLRPVINTVSLTDKDEKEFLLLIRLIAKFPAASKLIISGLINRYCFLKNLYEAMKYIFSCYRPEKVFVSYGQADGFRVIEKAAEDSSIPLFNVTHAAYIDRMFTPIHKTATMYVSCELVKKTLQKDQPLQNIIINGLMQMKHEYAMEEKSEEFQKPLVLIVQGLSQHFPALYLYDGMFRRIKTLAEIMTIPKHLEGKILVRCKSHPIHFEELLYKRVPVEASSFLPPLSSLEDILDKASVIIGFNYCGSAFLQGIEKKIPVAIFNTIQDEKRIVGGGFLKELQFKNIPIFATVSELWKFVEKIIFDEVLRKKILKNQEYINDELTIPYISCKTAYLDCHF